ncbi:hypothetical protein [Tichowtungia aerotolerans]|uniref:Uncharacterized protein n=1 Tax=Tichowtungia aerotolerans TaxID=2697043 RepID=A0A6P1M4D6_9BACT|nr:hypothetical protein [Tichowtungia aerotolerans]QHI68701.1 hypothetical protein GT409_04315 [Tichowtungia aerotolerans]
MKGLLCGMLLLPAGMSLAGQFLFIDTFDIENTQDINTNPSARQSGTQAVTEWTDSVNNNWRTQIYNHALRLYGVNAGGTVAVRLDRNFASVASEIKVIDV